MRESEILYQIGPLWVCKGKHGIGHYEIWKDNYAVNHAVRVGTYHFSDRPDYALEREIQRANDLARCLP